MTELTIHVGSEADTVAVVKILDENLGTVMRFAVDDSKTVSLKPGTYIVELQRPFQKPVRRHCLLSNSNKTIDFKEGPGDSGLKGLIQNESLHAGQMALESFREGERVPLAFVVWTYEPEQKTWTHRPLFEPGPTAQPHGSDLELYFSDGQALRFLQLSMARSRSVFVALTDKRMSVKLERVAGDPCSKILSHISVQDKRMQSLQLFLKDGKLRSSRAMIESLSETSDRLLDGKYKDAYGALIGAYFLVQTQQFGRLNWLRKLAEDSPFKWLPDGLILHAWAARFLDNAELNLKHSADQFLRAWQRGLPLYTQGFRYLYDGLRALSNEDTGRDQEISKALGEIRRYTDVLDWSSVCTRFYGAKPDQPVLLDDAPLSFSPEESLALRQEQAKAYEYMGTFQQSELSGRFFLTALEALHD